MGILENPVVLGLVLTLELPDLIVLLCYAFDLPLLLFLTMVYQSLQLFEAIFIRYHQFFMLLLKRL